MPRFSHTGDNFTSKSTVLAKWPFDEKWLFKKMPNSYCCDGFSVRLQIVLFTLGDPELNAVYSGNADARRVPRELVLVREWESLNAKAELARMHRVRNGVLSNQRGLHQCENGRRPKDPTVRREGTREPRRRGAICCFGLSRQPQVRRVWTVTFDSLFETVPKTLERALNITQPPSRRTYLIRRCGVVYYLFWHDMGGRRLSSWSCYASPIDGARCRASLLSRHLHYCQLGSFDVDASFLCDSWHSLARSHALCLPLPRGKTLEKKLRCGSADCRERATDKASSLFSCALVLYVKTYYFQSSRFSRTSSRRRLTQTSSYSSAHRSASSFPVGTLFLRRREQIAWFTATCPVLFRRSTSSHRCSSWTS